MKYLLIVFFTALVVGLGVVAYFKGWFPTLTFNKPQAVSVQNTEISGIPPATSEPTASSMIGSTTVKAGGILSMSSYSVDIPNDWQYSTTGSVPGQIDKLIISKGAYKITITQAAMGGGGCVYPGDSDQPMAQRFTFYVETTAGTKFRLGTLANGGVVACEMLNGSWTDLTEFGHIDYTYPQSPTQASLSDVSLILGTIKKISGATDANQTIIDALKGQLTNGTNLTVTVSKVEGGYAKGMASEQGGGGIWFAAKVSGSWKLVWSGNGIIYCSDIAPYPAFPKDLIPDCWDTSTNKLITR